jgi:hypothetical protein
MTKFLEVTVQVEQQDIDIVAMTKLNMLDAFPTYLQVSKHAQKISITDFAVLYYDLHDFYEKQLKRAGRYNVKELKRFVEKFETMHNLLYRYSEEKEMYIVDLFLNLRITFTNWLEAVTKEIDYAGE